MKPSVLILGCGVAGMSVAHELAERDFSVKVLESRAEPGGKARSVAVRNSVAGRRRPLPGEHGFRFFPGFYRHLPDTMRRIPYRDQRRGVLDNLRGATEAEIAQGGGRPAVKLATHFPNSIRDLELALHNALHPIADLSPVDVAYLASRLLILLTSCDERRYEEWESMSWWDFSGASTRNAAYQNFMADGLTRTLVAARAREMSARTGGCTLLQLLFDICTPGREADRVLNGPTSDVWIKPWLTHLRSLGVNLRFREEVEAIEVEDGRVTGVVSSGPRGRRTLHADWYVSAVPVEHMVRLASEDVKEADPQLANLSKLKTRWMNGIVFYLRNDFPIVHGHSIHIDSPWALTSISQRQFWNDIDFSKLGRGDVGGILSVDISEWRTPGLKTAKTAMECKKHEIANEVLAQLRDHLDEACPEVLAEDNIVSWFLDDDVRFPHLREEHGVRRDINLEPLLVNTPGSWRHRPKAATALPNLFLAADYVRTYTDLATMEGANEAARSATNAILDASGSPEKRCNVWRLHEPLVCAPARYFDRMRLKLGH